MMEEEIKVHSEEPMGFKLAFEVSALYLNVEDHYLYLQKSDCRPFSYEWCVPGGKIEMGETREEALYREVLEEIGVQLDGCIFLKSLYVCYPEYDFIFHVFSSTFLKKPEIRLSLEHRDHLWVKLSEAKQLPLISGGKNINEILFNLHSN